MVWWLATDSVLGLVVAILCGFLLIPVSAIFNCEHGWPRRVMTIHTLVLVGLIPASFLLIFVNEDLALLSFQAFGWGCVAACILGNFLRMTRVQH